MAAAPAAISSSKSWGGMTPPTTTMMSARPGSASACAELGHQGQVAGGQRGHADDVHVGLDRLAGHLRRRLEERADVDVEAEVGEGGGDDLLAPVVAVLAHLGHQDAAGAGPGARRTSRPRLERSAADGDSPTSARYTPEMVRIEAVWRPKTCSRASLISPTVARARAASTASFSRLCSSPAGRVPSAPARADPVSASRACRQAPSSRSARSRRSLSICWVRTARVVDLQHVDLLVGLEPVLVDADHRLPARVDPGLGPGGHLLDAQLGDPRLDGRGHPAGLLHLFDVGHARWASS